MKSIQKLTKVRYSAGTIDSFKSERVVDGIHEALTRHRSQLGRHISWTRCFGVGVWFLITLIFNGPEYVGFSQQSTPVAIYFIFALVWLGIQHGIPAIRAWPFLVVCTFDLPLIAWLQVRVSMAYDPPADNPITMLAAIGVLIVGLSVLSLRAKTVLLTSILCIFYQLIATTSTQMDLADTLLSVLLLSMAGVGSFAAVNYIRQINLKTAEYRAQRIAMGRYFSPAVAERITEHQTQSQTLNVTVLMCDLRGFTRNSEGMEPVAVVNWLNTYFDAMVEVVFSHGGTVDKIMGDGLLVYFGAPEPNSTHAQNAVLCALAMQHRLVELNQEVAHHKWPAYAIGIGLHSGPAILGNIGSTQRTDYTVIGDTVNVAARLEGLTKELKSPIVVSEVCQAAVPNMQWEALKNTPIRGRSTPLALFKPLPS